MTLIHLGSGLFDQLASSELSEQLAALYLEHGVEVLLEQEVAGFGGGGVLEQVLAGHGDGYDTVSSFFTEVFGLTVKVFGDVSRFDELTTDGSLASGSFLAEYGDEGRLVGALAVGQGDEAEARLKERIAARAPAGGLHRELVGGGRLH